MADVQQLTTESAPLRAAAIRSMISAPMCDGPEDWDVVQVENRAHADSFSEGDLDQLVLLSAHATVSLARLRRESRLQTEGGLLKDANRYLQIRDDQIICKAPALSEILSSLGSVMDSDLLSS